MDNSSISGRIDGSTSAVVTWLFSSVDGVPKPMMFNFGSSPCLTRRSIDKLKFLPSRLLNRLHIYHAGGTRSRVYSLRKMDMLCLYTLGKVVSVDSAISVALS
jgi:hypothetical protein